MGPMIAQTILQRELYVRTKFAFKLSWEYCLLDPMDIVTITDANLGLSNYPVRILAIEEDDKGLLAITAEELVFGVSTPGAESECERGQLQPNWAVAGSPGEHAADLPTATWRRTASRKSGSGLPAPTAGGTTNGAAQRLHVGRQCHLYADRRAHGSAAARFPDRGAPGGGGMGSADTLSVDLSESGGTLSGTWRPTRSIGSSPSPRVRLNARKIRPNP